MRTREECSWCMSTPDIKRKVSPGMPEEFKYRCSACHEMWGETHIECDCCHAFIEIGSSGIHYDKYVDMYICHECKDKHGFI